MKGGKNMYVSAKQIRKILTTSGQWDSMTWAAKISWDAYTVENTEPCSVNESKSLTLRPFYQAVVFFLAIRLNSHHESPSVSWGHCSVLNYTLCCQSDRLHDTHWATGRPLHWPGKRKKVPAGHNPKGKGQTGLRDAGTVLRHGHFVRWMISCLPGTHGNLVKQL